MQYLTSIREFLTAVWKKWRADQTGQLGAALAYYTMISLAPLLVIVVALAGAFVGQDTVKSLIIDQVTQVLDASAAEFIGSLIEALNPSNNLSATLIAIGTTLFGATGVFTQLQTSLNRIWNVAPKPGQGVIYLLRARLTSFLVILIIGGLLMFFIVLNTGLPVALNLLEDLLPNVAYLSLVRAANLFLMLGTVTLLFAMVYRLLPDARIAWRDVWAGAAMTAILFTVGQVGLGLYFANTSVGSAYGAAGSLVAVLVWVYYSAQILLLGGEFTQVWAERYGRRIVPANHAVRVVVETREVETGRKMPSGGQD